MILHLIFYGNAILVLLSCQSIQMGITPLVVLICQEMVL